MRELKFRMITQTTGKVLGYVDIYDLLRNGSDVLPDFEEAILEGVKFEQYTGLKDKNGKEIYEGDIIRYLSWRKERIGQVVFDFVDDSEGYYVGKHYGWGIRRDDWNFSLGDYSDDNMKCELIEVIGNIHENPELLGGEK